MSRRAETCTAAPRIAFSCSANGNASHLMSRALAKPSALMRATKAFRLVTRRLVSTTSTWGSGAWAEPAMAGGGGWGGTFHM